VIRRFALPIGIVCGLLGLVVFVAYRSRARESDIDPAELDSLPPIVSPKGKTIVESTSGPKSDEERRAILNSVMQLIQSAPTNPGGDNFTIAAQHLNQFFAGSSPAAFKLDARATEYLTSRVGAEAIRDLENPLFTIRDARHIEDCLLYHAIVQRVAGEGDDLSRVRRVFDWMVRHVQLVPPGSLAPAGGAHAQSRPYDVLLRGMAVEEGAWAERSWVFMSLCRQLGIDCGIVLYEVRSRTLTGLAATEPPADRRAVVWACAALVDGRPYLFDARIGRPIPKADGSGVATVDDAASDPRILAGLDLPGEFAYVATQSDIAGGKLTVWTDWSPAYFCARMRNLQENLGGRNRMVVYRDPAAVEAAFAQALGGRFAGIARWDLPLQVNYLLFNDSRFVESSLYAVQFFDAKLPLLPARMYQLRGALDDSVTKYVNFRRPLEPLLINKKQPVPAAVQQSLDQYATYFLGLAKLDQGDADNAEYYFRETLKLLPEPGRDESYIAMYRWGALSNLARLYDDQGKIPLAIRYYSEPKPTAQYHGDLLRARELVWRKPFVPDESGNTAPKAGTAATIGQRP
jgi:hypothetical protein